MKLAIEYLKELGAGTEPNMYHNFDNDLILYYIENNRIMTRRFIGYNSGLIPDNWSELGSCRPEGQINKLRIKKLSHHGSYGFCNLGTSCAFVNYNLDIMLNRIVNGNSYDDIDFSILGAIVTGHDLTFLPGMRDGLVDSETIDGTLDLCRELDERSFTLELQVQEEDDNLLDSYIDSICDLFYRDEPGLLRLDTFPPGTRLSCQLNGEISINLTMGYCQMSIPLLATDPVLYHDGDLFTLIGNGIAVNEGNMIIKPIFTLTGPASNPKIYVGDTYFEYTGIISSASTLVVDCLNEKAYIGGGNALKYSNRQFPVLVPGNNNVSCTSGSLVTEWRSALLSI